MSNSASTWMPLYVRDYLADTHRLTTAEHGAYLLIIMDYWVAGPPPDDDEQLALVTRLSAREWKKMRPKIAGFFRIEDGQWRHKRIDAELTAAQQNIEQKKAAGRASAARRGKQKPDAAPTPVPTAVPTPVATTVDPTLEREGQQKGNPSPSPTPIGSAPNGAAAGGPLDLRHELWMRGKRFLVEKHEIPKDHAGSLIGGWRKRFGDLAVLNALAAAEAGSVSNPIEYIEGCFKRLDHGRKPSAASPFQRAAELLDGEAGGDGREPPPALLATGSDG